MFRWLKKITRVRERDRQRERQSTTLVPGYNTVRCRYESFLWIIQRWWSLKFISKMTKARERESCKFKIKRESDSKRWEICSLVGFCVLTRICIVSYELLRTKKASYHPSGLPSYCRKSSRVDAYSYYARRNAPTASNLPWVLSSWCCGIRITPECSYHRNTDIRVVRFSRLPRGYKNVNWRSMFSYSFTDLRAVNLRLLGPCENIQWE